MAKKNVTSTRTNAALISDTTPFNILEAYKSARTNIIYAMPGDNSKVVLISSASPKEGKTTTCVNLAVVFAQTKLKIMLLDCDFRKPRIHRLFKSPNNIGLTDVLVGQKNLNEVIRHHDPTNLDYISCGTIPKTPAELLSSNKMQEILEECSKKYDYIFIDSPPVNVVSDALVIAPLASAIILIARQSYTDRELLKEAINKFRFVNCPPSGIILNDTKLNMVNYRYRYSYRNYRYKYKKYYRDYNYYYSDSGK